MGVEWFVVHRLGPPNLDLHCGCGGDRATILGSPRIEANTTEEVTLERAPAPDSGKEKLCSCVQSGKES